MKTIKNSTAFRLIKSLSMSEKRYFKIFSERHTIGSQNKYLVLFDILNKSEEEDDELIKKEFKKANINFEFLSADKNYLYNQVLGSLNKFHNSKTFNLEIKNTLLSVEILFYKGLYRECLKLISRIEPIAEECENFQLMIDILMWKKKCSGYSLGLKNAAEINQAIDKYILLLNNLKRITDLYYKTYFLLANYENTSKKIVRSKFRTILKQPELQSEKNAFSFSARIFYYLIYSNYYFVLDDKKKEFEYLQKLADILNASGTYAVENPLDYISIYNRLLSIKKYIPSSDFFNDIRVLKQFPEKVHIQRDAVVQRIFVHTTTNELEYYLYNDNFTEAIKKTKEIEKDISKLSLDIEPFHMIYFYHLIAVAFIFTGEFRSALSYINNILNNFNNEDRPQIYLRTEILNAVVHYELKNYSLVLSLAGEIIKKGRHPKALLPFEEKFLKSLIKISRADQITFKKEAENFRPLLDEMENGKLQKESYNFMMNNYKKWLKGKVERKFVSEIPGIILIDGKSR